MRSALLLFTTALLVLSSLLVLPSEVNAAVGRQSSNPMTYDVEWSTYLGGSISPGEDHEQIRSMTFDANGNVIIGMVTTSSDFPATNGSYDDVYDTSLGPNPSELVIMKMTPDGDVIWSTFLGGDGWDWLNGISWDPITGSICVTGNTNSDDFPVTANAIQTGRQSTSWYSDGFVSILSGDGTTLEYSSYIGTQAEGRAAYMYNGICTIGGRVRLSNGGSLLTTPTSGAFQTSPQGGHWDGWVAQFDTNGVHFVTYIGADEWSNPHCSGSNERDVDCVDAVHGLTVDGSGSIYLHGHTTMDGRGTNGAFQENLSSNASGRSADQYVARMSSDGSGLDWFTYLGGDDVDFAGAHPHDWAYEEINLIRDADDNLYVVGETDSTDFPTTPGAYDNGSNANYDITVTKMRSDGSVIWSTIMGGNNDDHPTYVTLDPSGDVGIMGFTNSIGSSGQFPFSTGANTSWSSGGDDAFVTRLSSDGSTIVYSTRLGGSGDDEANGGALYSDGTIFMAGSTASSDFPIVNHPVQTNTAFQDAINSTFQGPWRDAFLMRLDPPVPTPTRIQGLFVEDVPNDAGGELRATWDMSPETYIDEYAIFRETFQFNSVTNLSPVEIVLDRTQTTETINSPTDLPVYIAVVPRNNTVGFTTNVVPFGPIASIDNTPSAPAANPPPTPVTGLQVSDLANDAGGWLVADWDHHPSTEVAVYRLFQETSPFTSVQGLSPVQLVGSGTNSTLLRAPAGIQYHVGVVAVNSTGAFNDSVFTFGPIASVDNTVNDTLAPAPITGVTVLDEFPDAGGQLSVSWNPSGAIDLDHYEIYIAEATFSDVSGMSPSRVVNLSVSTAVASTLDSSTPLVDGTDYWAAVVAVDVAGNMDPMVTAAGPAQPQDNTPFVPPPLWIPMVEGLEIEDKSDEEVEFKLTWNETTMDPAMFGSYGVYSSETEFSNIIDADSHAILPNNDTTSHTLSDGFEFDTEYWFAVALADDDGNLNYQVISVSATASTPETSGIAEVIEAAQANIAVIAVSLGLILVLVVATVFVMGGGKKGGDRVKAPKKSDDFEALDEDPVDDLFSDTPIGGGSLADMYDA